MLSQFKAEDADNTTNQLVEQGYLEIKPLSTGKDGIGITREGYVAAVLLVLALTAEQASTLINTLMPHIIELDMAGREQ